MLDSLTPEQFDEWLAYRELEPDPVERIVRVLCLGFAALCGAWGGKIEPSYFDPLAKTGELGGEAEDVLGPNQVANLLANAHTTALRASGAGARK